MASSSSKYFSHVTSMSFSGELRVRSGKLLLLINRIILNGVASSSEEVSSAVQLSWLGAGLLRFRSRCRDETLGTLLELPISSSLSSSMTRSNLAEHDMLCGLLATYTIS